MTTRSQVKLYLQKAAGQLACARDATAELTPKPLELITRLRIMAEETVRMQKELDDHFYNAVRLCKNCGKEVTQGNHDHLWRHVLPDGSFPMQCPNSVAVAEPEL